MGPSAAVLALLLMSQVTWTNGYYVQPNIVRVVTHPSHQVAIEYSTVTFQCSINKTLIDSSLPAVEIAWFHDGSLASSCTRMFSQDLEPSVIVSNCIIESVGIDDQGWYQCRVIDGANETLCQNLPCVETVVTSRSAHLQIIDDAAMNISSVYLSSNTTSVILRCLLESVRVTHANFNITWKKDGAFIYNSTSAVEILPSGNLLVISNHNTVNEVFGTYECVAQLPNQSLVITQINLCPPPLDGESIQSSLSLELSFTSNVTSNIQLYPDSLIELVCLFNGLTYPSISWTHDGIDLDYWQGSTWLRMNQWQSGNYCCSVQDQPGMSCISIHVSDSDPIYMPTVFIDQSSTAPPLNCNSPFPMQWMHNGVAISAHSGNGGTVLLLTDRAMNETMNETYGIYECIDNWFNQSIVVYRVLPFGWTNPVVSYVPVVSLPAFNLSLKMDPPVFNGGLNQSSLSVRVKYDIHVNFFDVFTYTEILSGHFQSSTYTDNGDYRFYITIINDLGENISETTVTSIFHECTLYAPVPPTAVIKCGIEESFFQWEQSSLEPYPNEVTKDLSVQCFNDTAYSVYSENWLSIDIRGNRTIKGDIGTANGSCNFTVLSSRSTCIGSPSSGYCSITSSIAASSTRTSDIIITPSFIESPSNSIIQPTATSISNLQSVITSTISYMQPSPSRSSSNIQFTVSSINKQPVSSTSSSNTQSTVSVNTTAISINLTQTTVAAPPAAVFSNELVVIITVSLCMIIVILALTVLCLMAAILLWRQKRTRGRYIVESAEIFEGGRIILVDMPQFDTVSIKTICYDPLYSNTPYHDGNPPQDDNQSENRNVTGLNRCEEAEMAEEAEVAEEVETTEEEETEATESSGETPCSSSSSSATNSDDSHCRWKVPIQQHRYFNTSVLDHSSSGSVAQLQSSTSDSAEQLQSSDDSLPMFMFLGNYLYSRSLDTRQKNSS